MSGFVLIDWEPLRQEAALTPKNPSAPRCAALVGPYLSGKTSLLESILMATGAINRKGTIKEGNTVGDFAPEARARQMGTDLVVATTDYLGDQWTFIDCPGNVELTQDSLNALLAVDVAVVVTEPEPEKAVAISPLLKYLDDNEIPHFIFVNKMNNQVGSVKDTIDAMQAVSERPLVMREIPIREGEEVVGHVDLVSGRAFNWKTDASSELVEMPESVAERYEGVRTELLESLADFDDSLLEALLEDKIPDVEQVYGNLIDGLQNNRIVPVFFGTAEQDSGVVRLLKALRHEAPEPTQTAERLGIDAAEEGVLARVFKTQHAEHVGKLTFARVWRGEIADGMTLNGERLSGIGRMLGQKQDKQPKAVVGEVVALGRMDRVRTGALLSSTTEEDAGDWPAPLKSLYSLAINAAERADEVKISGALTKLVEEDPSLSFAPNADTGDLVIMGQGEMHLLIAIDRMRNRYSLNVNSKRPQIPYKESIRQKVSQHARHKKQSGGHGQFGDVHLDIAPLPRGSGFVYNDSITGGVVPKQYIPAVEIGVKDYLKRGPLGFQVVDVSVTLTDGQFHAVDSSDMAFRTAGSVAMREGMPKCSPTLLEPIFQVSVSIPTEFTSKIQRLVSGRRGQILGFDAKPGWKGWDEVTAKMPQTEMHDLINELRSVTLGVGTFDWKFDHLQELSGKLADDVVAARAEADKKD
jgi:elongation factor G